MSNSSRQWIYSKPMVEDILDLGQFEMREQPIPDLKEGQALVRVKLINVHSNTRTRMALGMTANGANGATYDEMRAALRLTGATRDDVDGGYKSLITLLRGLDPNTNFSIANSIWYDQTFPFNASFLDESKLYFDARVQALDFTSPAARLTCSGVM